MILTTGAAFNSDTGLFTTYLEQLVKRDVACLCIEMGHYLSSVPNEWIELAETAGLPLIIFPQAVRFIDITQDIHEHIINQHHQALKDLEKISREFHRMTLTSQGVTHVLQLLQSSLKSQVVYLPQDGQPHFIPHVDNHETKRWTELLEAPLRDLTQTAANTTSPELLEVDGQSIIIQPVGAMGKTWAHLVVALDRKPQEYEYLILDSASLSIAQDLLRKRYMEERKLYSQTLWVEDLLHLRIRDEEQIKALIGTEFKRLNELSYHVCLIEFAHGQETGSAAGGDDESHGIHLSLSVRSVFEQQAFHPLITLKNNRLIVLAFDQTPKKPAKERLQHVFQSLRHMKADEDMKLIIGVGQANRGFMNAYVSYQEAIQSISLSSTLQSDSLFFDELGVYQLLFHIGDKQALHAFVVNCLGPLIEHDRTRGSELLRTLKVYLDHDGSKQVVAQKLFIVRQSLYYRLEQIEELLGQDYMSPEKRIALQVALRVYQLLNPESEM